MKTWVAGMLAAMLMAGMALTVAAQAPGSDEVRAMSQAQLAQRLVERLGLWRFLGDNPTERESMDALTALGITPSAEGWKPDAPVTADVMARVLVLSLGAGHLVATEDQDDPQAWMNALEQLLGDLGILENVDGALTVLVPTEDSRVMIGWFDRSTDELRRTIVDVSEVLKVFRPGVIAPPPVVRRRAVTPDMPSGL